MRIVFQLQSKYQKANIHSPLCAILPKKGPIRDIKKLFSNFKMRFEKWKIWSALLKNYRLKLMNFHLFEQS